MTQVAQVMTRGVRSMARTDSLQSAAQAMDELNVGTLPVCENDSVIGLVTDRDIVVRGVAQGLPIETAAIGDIMSRPVECCHEDDAVEAVTMQMQRKQIRRVVVLDRNEHLVGMLSLGDVATKGSSNDAGDALAQISEPSEPDRSGMSAASGAAGGGAMSPSRKERDALQRSEKKASAGQPGSFDEKAQTEKIVEIPPLGRDEAPIRGLDPKAPR